MTSFYVTCIVSVRRSTMQASVTPAVFCSELRLEGRIQKGITPYRDVVKQTYFCLPPLSCAF